MVSTNLRLHLYRDTRAPLQYSSSIQSVMVCRRQCISPTHAIANVVPHSFLWFIRN
jgi:hypothetical protein